MPRWFSKKVPTEDSRSPSATSTRSMNPMCDIGGYTMNYANQLLRTGKYSDLTLSCQGRVFHVHRVIVCPQVQFVECAVRSGLKEAVESHIDFPADDPRMIDMVVSWCYSRDSSFEDEHDMFQLYLVADKFGISDLKEYTYLRMLSWTIESCFTSQDFPYSVEKIWREAPPHEKELRHKMVQLVAMGYKSSREEDWKRILRDNPELAMEVLDEVGVMHSKLSSELEQAKKGEEEAKEGVMRQAKCRSCRKKYRKY